MTKKHKSKPIARPTQTLEMYSPPSIFWLLIGIVIIAIIGISRNNELNKTPAPPKPAAVSDWQKVTDVQALFSTAVLLERNKTFVLIPIRFENNIETVWLNYDSTPSAQPTQFLITHPTLINLNWNRLDKGVIHLYQKNKTYNSIDDFLSHPPEKSKLMIDDGVYQINPYRQLASLQLTDQPNLDDIDYILTTYIPLQEKNGAYYYENIIDASGAIINHKNSMSWMVYAPKASVSNPYYLGSIHIDYRR